MGQDKLRRFAEIKDFKNVLEFPENKAGQWHDFFGNQHPITLELACGKGEYALGLGRLYRNRNFIGIDIKGNRLWKGAKTAMEMGLDNVAFLRIFIDQIHQYFADNEVAEIWITFPDPQLRISKMKQRLTHPKYLRHYQKILQPEGLIHLKTDSPTLYNFTKGVIDYYHLFELTAVDNIHEQPSLSSELAIKTHYEQLDIAGHKKIHHIAFKPNKPLPKEKDKAFKAWMKEREPETTKEKR